MRNDEARIDGLSDQFVVSVGPEDELSWARDGAQESQLRRLKQSPVPSDSNLGLYGMSVEKARQTLWDFPAETTHLEIHCVRVIHGKAARKGGHSPLAKSHVDTWSCQHPQVLGFTSCLPRHGGAGSAYVMLCRTTLEGRDEQLASAESCQWPGGVLPSALVIV